jgi:hypothetical protein
MWVGIYLMAVAFIFTSGIYFHFPSYAGWDLPDI